MNKGKIARLAGFAGALGLTTVLVTTAVQGTGAYFTSSVPGTLTGTTGHLQVASTSTSVDFSPLNPGQDATQPINYHVTTDSTTHADIWLVFNPNSWAYGSFTGASSNAAWTFYQGNTAGGLGQYGHFAVKDGNGNVLFQSYNLAYDEPGTEMTARLNESDSCNVDKYGHGGSGDQHSLGENSSGVNWCGVPAAILLQSDVAPSANASTAYLVFGLTGKMSAQDSKQLNIPFQIVATQPGQYPLVQAGTTDPQKVGQGNVGTNW